MTAIRKFFVLVSAISATAATAQYTDEINSNRPGKSMSAFAVGQSVFQVETGIYGIYEEHEVLNYKVRGAGLDAQVRYGAFLEELEIVADFQYQFDGYTDALETSMRNDFRQITIGGKFLFYDPDKNYHPEPNIYSWKANHKFRWRNLIPAMGVYAGFNLMGKNNPYTFPDDGISPKAMFITHNHFGRWVWVNNFVADKIATDYPSYGIISTVTRGFNARWSGFLEFQGFKSDWYADGILRTGAAYLLSPMMQLDASVSGNFKNTPMILYGGVGFSWRFDADYKDILLPGKGDREDELKKEQDKFKKDKAKIREERRKKRRDAVVPDAAPATAPDGGR
ncbi:transporter [uncultured Flavobacterium sp.]|uniref:transporter n=1 Tax=uncultured Flavobacterium sp. TaxID=165435 RepID=UPI0025FB4418|nr:transporter [uncultured Flavobacterium sp.]